MDPALDPPPVAAQAAAAIPAVAAAPAPAPIAAALNHPPYAEMISAAITALNERDGSSKRAIAKYIETNYSDLPPTHSALLTHHLKRLKTGGQLLMVKHSYTLPGLRSTLAPAAVNGAVTAVESSADLASTAAKRRPGRPPKPKPDAVHVAVPVFPPPINMNDAPVFASEPPGNATALPENAHIAAVPANGTPVRGRGRPPKQGGAKRGPGRPPKSSSGGGGGSGGRGRGRPKKSGTAAPVAAPAAVPRPGRPRGRPPKPINVVEGFAPVSGGVVAAAPVSAPALGGPVTGKRRGRPPKAGNEAKKPRNMNAALPKRQRNLSGKPLGRPRKNAQATVNRTPDSQLLVAYLDLKAKLENLQSTVKQAATLIRPSLTSEAAVNALQELELVALNVSAPPNAQTQQQPLPEQVQPQS